MKIRDVRVLRGPNVWAACPVLEIVLDLEDFRSDGEARSVLRQFVEGLLDGEGGDGTTAIAHALAAATAKLQAIAGTPVTFFAARDMARPGLVLAAVEFAAEAVAREALDIAWRLLVTPADDGPLRPTAGEVRRLKDIEAGRRLPPTVAVTFDGVKRRGVPVAQLSPEYSGYLVLGHGSKQRRVRWSEPDAVSGVARLASTDKYLTKQLLESIGVPVPRGRLVASVEEAWPAANEVGLPVAVKPYNTDLQTGVALNLRVREKVEAAFRAALEHSSFVLVEHFAPGMEHRVLVVGERVVAVTRIDPPHVIGDGVCTVGQLVDKVNQDPRRGDDDRSDAPLAKLKLDEVALAVLASQSHTPESVPPAGQQVLVRRDPPYYKNGGTLTDLTSQIHPSIVGHAIASAQIMQIPVAGLDVVAVDIARPLEEQGGVVVEVNANPGFWLHLAPWADSPRPIGDEVAAWLFPPGNDGRIPVVALVGDEGWTTRRNLAALLERGGYRVGTAGSRELSAGGRRWPAPAGTPHDRAFVLFRHPAVDAALIETDADELLHEGFANDRCDVAVVLSPVPAAKGQERDPAEFVEALRHALNPAGDFVVSSAWPPARLGVVPSRVILVAVPEDAETMEVHLASGGRAVLVRGQDVVLRDGAQPMVIGPVPGSLTKSEAKHLLAAVAAAWSLGLVPETAAGYLSSLA